MERKASIWREEFRRALNPKRLGLLLLLSAIILYIGWTGLQDRVPYERSFIDNWYGIYNDSFYPQLLALIAAFPFADSLVLDRKQGYLNQVLARTPYRKYLKAKAVVNALVGGLVAVMPLLLTYLLSSLLTGNPLNHPSVDQMALRPYSGFLRELYFNQPDGFIWLVLGLCFLIGASSASLGLAASLLVNNRFFALGLPLVLLNVLQYFAERTRILPDFLSPSYSLLNKSYSDIQLIQTPQEIPKLFILPGLVFLLAILGFVFLGKREMVTENKTIFESFKSKSEPKAKAINAKVVNLKAGKFPARFYSLFKRSFKPAYLLILVLIIFGTGFFFSRFLSNQGDLSLILGVTGDNLVNAWDVVFIALGNPWVMSLLIANSYLIFVSSLQPETGFGQISLFRLGSRKKNWLIQILYLFFSAVFYVFVVMLGLYLVGIINGYPPASQWSATTAFGGTWVNIPHWLPHETSLAGGLAMIFVLLSLGFFAMGLMIYTINTIVNRRLIGYLIVELFLLSSIGLAHGLIHKAAWLQALPLIQNLLLSLTPYGGREIGMIWQPYIYWLLVLVILIPLSLYFYRKQDFAVKTDEE